MKCVFCDEEMVASFTKLLCPNGCYDRYRRGQVVTTYDHNEGFFYLGETCPECGCRERNKMLYDPPLSNSSDLKIKNGIRKCFCACGAEWKIEFINYED